MRHALTVVLMVPVMLRMRENQLCMLLELLLVLRSIFINGLADFPSALLVILVAFPERWLLCLIATWLQKGRLRRDLEMRSTMESRRFVLLELLQGLLMCVVIKVIFSTHKSNESSDSFKVANVMHYHIANFK